MLLLVCLDISDLYLFHLTVLLNPAFNCYNKLLSPWTDKVMVNTYNLVSVILNVAFVELLIPAIAGFASGSTSLVALLVNKQFADHVKVQWYI